MLVERIQEIVGNINSANENELYHFNYGAAHWQNVNDFPDDGELPFEERNKYVLLLWQDRDKKFNEYGSLTGYEFTGEMLLVVRSQIMDADYNDKYERHIKDLYAESDKMDSDFNSCEEWLVTRWKEIEVENVYDTNVDGLKILFTLTYNLEA